MESNLNNTSDDQSTNMSNPISLSFISNNITYSIDSNINFNEMINIDRQLGSHINGFNYQFGIQNINQLNNLSFEESLNNIFTNTLNIINDNYEQELTQRQDQELDQEPNQDLELDQEPNQDLELEQEPEPEQEPDQEHTLYQQYIINIPTETSGITIEAIKEEIDGIIKMVFEESLQIDEIIQDNIRRTDIYLRSIFFDLENLNDSFDRLFVTDIIKYGLESNTDIKTIIENIYSYYLINYCDADLTVIMNDVKEISEQILFRIRQRNHYRDAFFTNILNTFTNILGGPSEETDVKITDELFNKQFITDKYENLKLGNCATDCAICKLDYDNDNDVTILPCSKITADAKDHCFHTDCIKTWMTEYHSNCPVCKTSHSK